MKWGIEFEYLLVDSAGSNAGRVRDFANLDFTELQKALAEKPGTADMRLARGDLGIRSGYWYLEGDERFDRCGQFRTLEVKGVEARTPPVNSLQKACDELLSIERQLTEVLARHGLQLGIAGFNPVRASYEFSPPLNDWELAMRRSDRGYEGSEISTLTYGPDINLSNEAWSTQQLIDNGRKLSWCSPYIVPFSFSSPFYSSARWDGWSVRTHHRAARRPSVRCFCGKEAHRMLSKRSTLAHPARVDSECGRLEFKAFDAITSPRLLRACCALLHGLCLDTTLSGRREAPDLGLYERAARHAFDDSEIWTGATHLVNAAKHALQQADEEEALESLQLLENSLRDRRTPAHALAEAFRTTGLMYVPGGLCECAASFAE